MAEAIRAGRPHRANDTGGRQGEPWRKLW